MVASTVWLLPAALATAPGSAPALGPVAAVATLGVVGTGLAFAIFYTLIAREGPARSFIVAYLAPGFAVAYGAVLLGEQITAATIAGLALILAGSWLAVEGAREGCAPLLARKPSLLDLPRRRPGPRARAKQRRHAIALGVQLRTQRVKDADHAAGPIASAHSERPRGQLEPRRMATSTSSAVATPSPTAKCASLTIWQTIRPSTRPGASPTHSTCLPMARK